MKTRSSHKFGLIARAAALALFLPSTLSAAFLYTVQGRFPATAPASAYSAPNRAFTLTFLVPSDAPNDAAAGQAAKGYAPLHAGTYTFNGTSTAFVGGSVQETSVSGQPEFTVILTRGVLSFQLTGNGTVVGGSNLTALALTVPGETPAIRFTASATSATAVNAVVYDVVGYFPVVGTPVSPLSASAAGFLVEFALPLGATGQVPFLYGEVTYQGVAHPCDLSQSLYNFTAATGLEQIVCVTGLGNFELYSLADHFPLLYQDITQEFTGALGPGQGWALYCTAGPSPFSASVVLTQFLSRNF